MLFSTRHIVFIVFSSFYTVNAAKDPTFTKIYDGTIFLDSTSLGVLPGGPSGKRALFPFLGGNLTSSSTGEVVAKIIPGIGGEMGVITEDGAIFPDVRLVTQWVDDQKFAFWEFRGVGLRTIGAHSFVRLETNSASRLALTTSFLLSSINVTEHPAKLAIYKLDD